MAARRSGRSGAIRFGKDDEAEARALKNAPSEPVVSEAQKARQRSSKRRQYMGQNPNKSSTTYREVVARMEQEGKIKLEGGVKKVLASDGTWISLEEAELSHTQDAMNWWNQTGKYWGEKHVKVREFMTDSKNYVLDKPSLNRSAGAKLKGIGYDPPDPRAIGPPQPPSDLR